MGDFSKEVANTNEESSFMHVQLEGLFKDEAERQAFEQVRQALRDANGTNQAVQDVLGMGDGAVGVLVKIATKALAL